MPIVAGLGKRQSLLPGIDEADPRARAHGLVETHSHPLCSRGKIGTDQLPLFDTPRRRPAAIAWERYADLELRSATAWTAMVLDIDRGSAHEDLACQWADGALPLWNWLTVRRSTGRLHGVWTLKVPIHRGPSARRKPLLKYGRIVDYFTLLTGADQGYPAVLTHRPGAPESGGLYTVWGREEPHTLESLGGYIQRGWRRPLQPVSAPGRNSYLFGLALKWAGHESNLNMAALDYLVGLNDALETPLGFLEVRGIAKSVERYRAEWAARGWHKPGYLEGKRRQGAEGGRIWGRARRNRNQARDRAILDLWIEGHGVRAIGIRLALPASTVQDVVERAGPGLLRRQGRDPRVDPERDRAILDLLAAGHSERAVADRLGCSQGMVQRAKKRAGKRPDSDLYGEATQDDPLNPTLNPSVSVCVSEDSREAGRNRPEDASQGLEGGGPGEGWPANDGPDSARPGPNPQPVKPGRSGLPRTRRPHEPLQIDHAENQRRNAALDALRRFEDQDGQG